MEIVKPIVELIDDTNMGLKKFKIILKSKTGKERELINEYPIVYIHNWQKGTKYEVYVGESNDFFQRTLQHYEQIENPNSWQKNLKSKVASLYVIAHEDFNKSLTLDVENKLIHYLSSCSSVEKIYNARGNPQNKYYPCEEFDAIFSNIWKQLRRYNRALFLSESEIKDSAIYKASPLHKLNFEQNLAKEKILDTIQECLIKNHNHQMVLVQGDAGTGKTVLMSSMFYELINHQKVVVEEGNDEHYDIETAIIVNHEEQLTVYKEIVKKLDLVKNNENIVFKPTEFINLFLDKKNSPKKRKKLYDVVFIDEAHLLLTQKNQAFTQDDSQLDEIIKYAKIVVVMFDKKQIMNAEQYISNNQINKYINLAKFNDSYIELKIQMRMRINKSLQKWLQKITEEGIIDKCPYNRGKYEIVSFDTPFNLEKAIKEKALIKETALSRIIATYDWKYSGTSSPKNDKYWKVTIGTWSKPWNRELIRYNKVAKKNTNGLAWAEQPQTINEVGSTYTIQGFDLNYAGVILGPSIKYRNGKIMFDPSKSCNHRATQRRKLKDGTSKSFGEIFLKNELGVLLTRGVNGLYIYACDEELRKKLNKSINK